MFSIDARRTGHCISATISPERTKEIFFLGNKFCLPGACGFPGKTGTAGSTRRFRRAISSAEAAPPIRASCRPFLA